jgi:hypothetical protein
MTSFELTTFTDNVRDGLGKVELFLGKFSHETKSRAILVALLVGLLVPVVRIVAVAGLVVYALHTFGADPNESQHRNISWTPILGNDFRVLQDLKSDKNEMHIRLAKENNFRNYDLQFPGGCTNSTAMCLLV